jgi:hypothetical protein
MYIGIYMYCMYLCVFICVTLIYDDTKSSPHNMAYQGCISGIWFLCMCVYIRTKFMYVYIFLHKCPCISMYFLCMCICIWTNFLCVCVWISVYFLCMCIDIALPHAWAVCVCVLIPLHACCNIYRYQTHRHMYMYILQREYTRCLYTRMLQIQHV